MTYRNRKFFCFFLLGGVAFFLKLCYNSIVNIVQYIDNLKEVFFLQGYFLQQKNFTSKKGVDCHTLVICDQKGDVYTFFHDGSIFLSCGLFAPVELELDFRPYGNNFKPVLLSAREVQK